MADKNFQKNTSINNKLSLLSSISANFELKSDNNILHFTSLNHGLATSHSNVTANRQKKFKFNQLAVSKGLVNMATIKPSFDFSRTEKSIIECGISGYTSTRVLGGQETKIGENSFYKYIKTTLIHIIN